MLNHDLLFSVPCCFLLDGLIKEATCNVMVDHLQSRVTSWRQYASHVKVRGTLSKMDVSLEKKLFDNEFKRNTMQNYGKVENCCFMELKYLLNGLPNKFCELIMPPGIE